MIERRYPLWVLRIAFRTVGTVAPGIAARWAEAIRNLEDRFQIRWKSCTFRPWPVGIVAPVLIVTTATIRTCHTLTANRSPARGQGPS